LRIGLIGPPDDPQLQRLDAKLDARGAEAVWLDPTQDPSGLSVTLAVDETPSLQIDGEPVDDVAAWYARRLGLWDPTLPDEPTPEQWDAFYDRYRSWHAAETEKAITIGSILEILAEASTVVNPPHSVYDHLRKSYQLARMKDAGVPVPAFQVTTDPEDAIAFAEQHDRVVYKPRGGRRYVLEVTPEVVHERREAFDTEPVFLQRLVDGDHHRVFVIDDMIAAGRFRFDPDERVDYRAAETEVEPVELPDDVEELCRTAMEASRMTYTGLDLILDEEGDPWFLECNPSPMFAVFEDKTGYPISDRLADHLVAAGRG
jgi:glutathione synthase/RimK-type ligase-like ATP-grasp enzyme